MKKKARRRQVEAVLHRAHGDSFDRLMKLLAEDAQDADEEAPDPRLAVAKRLESLASMLKPEKAKQALDQAKYLRACVKYGIEED